MALPSFYGHVHHVHTHRIHGAGIYTNIGGILMVNVTIYSIHGSYGICHIFLLWFYIFYYSFTMYYEYSRT